MHSKYILLAVMVVSLLFSFAPSADASVVVVDVKRIMDESKAAKSIREQGQTLTKALQQELQISEKELKAAKQQLDKKKAVLSKEAFEKEFASFQKKVATSRLQANIKIKSLEKAMSKATRQIDAALSKIINNAAVKAKYSVVLPKGITIYASDRRDITDYVLKALDAKLPEVKIEIE